VDALIPKKEKFVDVLSKINKVAKVRAKNKHITNYISYFDFEFFKHVKA